MKIYKSRYSSHNLILNVGGKRFPVLFVNGLYASENADVQKAIESLSVFHTGVISIKPQSEVDAEAKAHAEHIASLDPHKEKVQKAAEAKAAAKANQSEADKASAEANAKAEAERLAKIAPMKNGQMAAAAVAKKKAAKASLVGESK